MDENILTLDNYKLKELIFKRSNSKLYLGNLNEVDKNCVFKILKRYKEENNFDNEIQILSNFDHDNIVKILKYNLNGNLNINNKIITLPYVVFDYYENGEFFDYLNKKGRLKENIARKYFIDLINTVSYIHEKGYAHRDLKPENILLDDNFQIKLIGFEFSTSITNNEFNINKLKSIKGTISYRAPEILNSEGYDGKKADIFSLGVILFLFVIGRPPFIQASNKCKYFHLILIDNIKKFWTIHQKLVINEFIIPENLKTLINSMLNPDPKKRISIDEIKNSSWILDDIANDELIFNEMNNIKELIKNENNIKFNEVDENFIKPNFRNSTELIIKNVIQESTEIGNFKTVKWNKNFSSNNRKITIKLNNNNCYKILLEIIKELNGEIIKTKNNKIKCNFIINKELDLSIMFEIKIFSNENKSEIKIMRLNGSNYYEWKIINDIKENLSLYKIK